MARWQRVAYVICLVAVVAVAFTPLVMPTAATDSSPTGGTVAVVSPLQDTQPEPDLTRNIVSLQPNGDAEWTIEYRTTLDTENTTDAFLSYQEQLENNSSFYQQQVTEFTDQFNRTVAAASNETGREMRLQNVSLSTELGPSVQYGAVRYEFTWTNFSVVTDDRITAGDAVSGLILAEDVRFIVKWPGQYRLVSATDPYTELDGENGILWDGRDDIVFDSDEPRVTVERVTETGSGILPFVAAGGLAIAGGLAWLVLSGRLTRSTPERDGESAGTTASTDTTSASQADTETPASDGDDTPSEELLTNEEQVLKLLEEKGGRMKQQDVVSELGWTEAKTSQVITGMREDDQIEVYRIGRENVIAHPDEDIL